MSPPKNPGTVLMIHSGHLAVRAFRLLPRLVAPIAIAALIGLVNQSFVSSGDSRARLSFKARQDLLAVHYPTAVAAADLNGDGIPDIVVGNYGSGNVAVFYGSPAGSFEAPKKFPVGAGPIAVVIADFNKDGHPDI